MRIGRAKKSKTPSPRTQTAPARQARPQTRPYNNTAGDGLPGLAGYPDGPTTELPNFFHTRRPDGRNEAPRRRSKGFSPR